jgi:hypothetical protein
MFGEKFGSITPHGTLSDANGISTGDVGVGDGRIRLGVAVPGAVGWISAVGVSSTAIWGVRLGTAVSSTRSIGVTGGTSERPQADSSKRKTKV